MKLGDMAHCKTECRARMTFTRQGPDPRVIVLCLGTWNRIAASLDSEMQNSFGNCLTEMEHRTGHAEFYLHLGRHVLHD